MSWPPGPSRKRVLPPPWHREQVYLGEHASANLTRDGDLHLVDGKGRSVYLTPSQTRQLFASYRVKGQPELARRG